MGLKWNSIMIKVFVAFVLVMLPLYILGIRSIFTGMNQMKAQIDAANISKLQFHYSHIEFEMSRISKQVTEASNNNLLNFFPTTYPVLNNYEVASAMNQIYIELRQILVSSPYIKDVIYYVPVAHKTISATNYISDYKSEEASALLNSRGNLQSSISVYQNQLYFLISVPFNLNNSVQPNFMLAVQLDSDALLHTLNSFNNKEEGGAAIIFGEGSVILASEGALSQSYGKLPAMQERSELTNSAGKAKRLEIDNSVIYYTDNPGFGIRLVESVPLKLLHQPAVSYFQSLLIITGIAFGVIILFSYYIWRAIHRPLMKLIRAFRFLEDGQTDTLLTHERKDEFGYLYDRYNGMLIRLQTLIEDNYIQRIRSQEAILKQLQSQITPHFLYNSLFTVKQMAEMEDVDSIKEFSEYLGTYFRFITRNESQEIPLEEEYEHAITYMRLQEMRFAPRIKVSWEALPDGTKKLPVPRLVLQPLIENAFEHGLKDTGGKGVVVVTVIQSESDLEVVVEDNGGSLNEEKLERIMALLKDPDNKAIEQEVTGMLNVHQRLRIRYGYSYGIYVSRSELGGLKVSIRIPV
ncbi:sensor histidine kinase [Paenibacillus silvae]|uniref:sensor histidine kinase n=1 Tax=Paenibacillus silvae TaxID=1325358 RepID=UPI003CFB64F2